jgi:hypothetical protein
MRPKTALVIPLMCSGVGGWLLSGLLEVESLELRVESCVFVFWVAVLRVVAFALGAGFRVVAFFATGFVFLFAMIFSP